MRKMGWTSKAVFAVGIAIVSLGISGCGADSVTGPDGFGDHFGEDLWAIMGKSQLDASKGVIPTHPRGIETSPIVPPRIPAPPSGR